MSKLGTPTEHQLRSLTGVPTETADLPCVEQKEELHGSLGEPSTGVHSVVRNQFSKRCVNCVSSAVALRKRSPELRISEWRTGVLRSVAFAYPSAPPKSTLAGVFERMKRAARKKMSVRISERFAPQFQRSASPAQATRWLAAKRVRESESVKLRLADDE